MSLQAFIEQYGLIAVFVGCLLEGETVLVMGAVSAHLGYLSLPKVLAVAAVAGFLGDQIWFRIGRSFGPRLLERHPDLASRVGRARTFLERHGDWMVLFMRFAVGLRTAIPMALGAGSIPYIRYVVLNAIGAVLWALVFGTAGYIFGNAVVAALRYVQHDVEIALVIVLVAGIGWVVLSRALSRRQTVEAPPAD